MTQHDLISSYIDNELTREQEQEFLIKLAANDNLRNSFRTELTLKNIVQRDESLITPPRALRASVFAAVGLSAAESAEAATVAAATQSASQSTSFFKGLFATKLNTAFTTLGLSVATLFGYVGHDMLNGEQATPVQAVQSVVTQPVVTQPVSNTTEGTVSQAEKPVAQSAIRTKISRVAAPQTKAPATTQNTLSTSSETPQTGNSTPTDATVIGSGDGDMQSTVTKSSEAK